MEKVKLSLTKSEVSSLMSIIGNSMSHGGKQGLTRAAAHEILSRLMLKLLTRYITLKEKKNSFSFSIPEVWALAVLSQGVMHLFGAYEQVVIDKITSEARRKTA
jgi:hypothetical protein